MANICKYEKKFGYVLYVKTILLFKLIVAQTIAMILSNKSICVSGTIFCSMQNFFARPITVST